MLLPLLAAFAHAENDPVQQVVIHNSAGCSKLAGISAKMSVQEMWVRGLTHQLMDLKEKLMEHHEEITMNIIRLRRTSSTWMKTTSSRRHGGRA
jgi:hypothetical protein